MKGKIHRQIDLDPCGSVFLVIIPGHSYSSFESEKSPYPSQRMSTIENVLMMVDGETEKKRNF